jgi:hypothetical protein
MKQRWPSITCPECRRTSYNPNDIREGYCGFCHAWTSNPLDARMHNPPRPGTWLIVVELPPRISNAMWFALVRHIAHAVEKHVPGAFVHGSRLMSYRGKHVKGN